MYKKIRETHTNGHAQKIRIVQVLRETRSYTMHNTFDVNLQVQLACKVQKPLLLHEREAHEAFLKILNKYQADLPAVVCHCFTGRRNEALTYLSMGFYIGVTGES